MFKPCKPLIERPTSSLEHSDFYFGGGICVMGLGWFYGLFGDNMDGNENMPLSSLDILITACSCWLLVYLVVSFWMRGEV